MPQQPARTARPRRYPASVRGCAAFSLVELVVVLTTLIALASLTLPLITKVREDARSEACQANLKSLHVPTMQFAEEVDYLPSYHDEDGNGWVIPLGNLSGQVVEPNQAPTGIFACPSQPNVPLSPLFTATEYWHGSHYGINQHITSVEKDANGEPLPHFTRMRIDRQGNDPAQKVLFGDTSGLRYGVQAPDSDPVIAGLSTEGRTYADGMLPDPARPFPLLRHGGGTANFLFLDGHVEQRASWPEFSLGPGTAGYMFWHGEHAYPGSGRERPAADAMPPAP